MPAPFDCPWTTRYEAFFDADLSPADRQRYEEHLESCPVCQRCLDRSEIESPLLRKLGRQVGDPTSLDDDPALSNVLERLHEATAPPPSESLKPNDPLRRRIGFTVLLLVAGLGLPPLLTAQAAGPDTQLRPEQVHRFDGRPLPPKMTLFGPLADQFLKMEQDGLRITLPRERDEREVVGLTMPVTVEGDFEFTTTFETLHADEPPPGASSFGVGFLMSLNEAARIGCLLRSNGRQVLTWDRWANVNGERKWLDKEFPCTSKSGRLRLARTGTMLHFLWSPEREGERFDEFYQFEFGPDDITLLRLEFAADLGGKPAALDVRLIDLRVRSSGPGADQIFGAAEGAETGSKGWLVAATVLCVIILSSVAVGMVMHHRRSAGKTPIDAGESDSRTQPVPSTTITVLCSSCGKTLKGSAELAGKKVQCPGCGQTLLVPSLQIDKTSSVS